MPPTCGGTGTSPLTTAAPGWKAHCERSGGSKVKTRSFGCPCRSVLQAAGQVHGERTRRDDGKGAPPLSAASHRRALRSGPRPARVLHNAPMNLREVLTGAVVMGPMTKGSNLPYRRLCVELGARVTVSEMTVARRLKQKRRAEFALIRRAADEPCFAVQLAGTTRRRWGGQPLSSSRVVRISWT